MRFLLFLSLFATIACKQKQPANPVVTTSKTQKTPELSAEFLEFYKRFHQDSAFQMAHIIWPLEGNSTMTTDGDKVVQIPVKRNPSEWVMHKPLDSADSDFVQNWSFFDENVIEETIKYSAANYGMRRRWAKVAGEWHLIFYSDMQELR